MYLPRAIHDACESASRQFPVLLLTGPRQVGKTTLLRRMAGKNRSYVTLDDPASRELARSEPALFLQRYEPPVLIDEVQYAPELLPHIKMAVDEPGRHKPSFWLTGSQQFQLMKGISETLAGRVAILNLLGVSGREQRRGDLDALPFVPTSEALQGRSTAPPLTLKRAFREIWLGGFPALVTKSVRDRDLFYSSYVQTYLQRDIRDLARVGDESSFLRFLKACAARTAQLLNLSELARDADIAVNTAKSWLSILQASFQVILVPPYHTNVTKRLVKSPKLHFLDSGLCAYLAEWSSPETLEAGAMGGAIFESYVVAEVLKSWWNRGKQPQLYHYRDKEQREVDILLVQDRTVHAIEAKKSVTPRRSWCDQLRVAEDLGLAAGSAGVVCLCRDVVPIGHGVNAIPLNLI